MMFRLLILISLLTSSYIYADTKLLIFAGSTREGSYNQLLSKEAAKVANKLGAEVIWIDLKNYPMPFYNQDLETVSGMPPEAIAFRRLMVSHDAIFIASPDYNGSFSALLKNALDWASRSEDGKASKEAFQGKRFAIASASPGKKGGASGLNHLRDVIEDLKGVVIEKQVSVPQAYQLLDSAEHFENSPYYSELEAELRELLNK